MTVNEAIATITRCSRTFQTVHGPVTVINTTPHPITFQDVDGTLVSIPSDPALLVNATPVTEPDYSNPLLVHTTFQTTPKQRQLVADIWHIWLYKIFPKVDGQLAIVGSMIAVNAYPGRVVGMVPVPGYERVAPAEKRMRCDCFTVA